MSDSPDLDFRAKFLKLLGYSAVVLTMATIFWAVISLGRELIDDAQEVRCQNNLTKIVQAFEAYNLKFGNTLPPHLYALKVAADVPDSIFQCPADPDKGRKGCRPAWLRKDDGELFKHTDLDGPGIDPKRATDRLPSSYLYAANAYPCGLPDINFEYTWAKHLSYLVEDYGRGVPMVRCYYHLPINDTVPDPDDPNFRVVNPSSSPTFNITRELELREYELDWIGDPTRKKSN
jgi:hypothetical protein